MIEGHHPVEAWQALLPQQAAMLLDPTGIPWWIAGGWAIDLFLGRATRDHADMDIAVPRAYQADLARAFAGWDIQVAMCGTLARWDAGDWLEGGPRHQLWARPHPGAPWTLEFLLEEGSETHWHYRRNAGVTLPWPDFGRRDADGIPFVAPEVALLYKSTDPDSCKNAGDFAAALPCLPEGRKCWLAAALDLVHPGHGWRDRL